MIQNSQYRSIPTDLQLNGPILSFTTTPSDTTLGVGQSAYFTGIATAQFPDQTPANPAVGFATGTIQYQWYEVTEGQLSEGTKYVGTATTELIISDIISPDDNGKQYYLSADYVAIGTSPNANNESFTSSRATLSIYPEIRITEHPADVTVGLGGQSTFEVEAELTDGSYGNLNYQWRFDSQIITDGTYTSASVGSLGIRSVQDDAVLLLPFNESDTESGTVSLRDYSDNTKTITPGSTYGDAPVWQNTGFATGNFYNGAAYFNGSTSYINVSGSSDFKMTDQPFTMEAWIKWSDNSWSGTWEVMACIGGGYYSDGGIWWAILRNDETGSDTTFYISHSGGYSAIANNIDIKADDNEWHHFAVTRTSSNDGHLIRMWMDGEKIGENSEDFVNKNFGGEALGYIGLEHAGFHNIGYYYPNCWMQDFRCYKGLDKYAINFTPSDISILGTSVNKTQFNEAFPAALAMPLWNKSGQTNNVDIEDISINELSMEFGSTQITWDTSVKKWYDGSALFPNKGEAALKPTNAPSFTIGVKDFTIEAWCYFTKISWSDIFSTDNYNTFNSNSGLFAFRKSSSETLSFYCNPDFESINQGVTNGDPIPQDTWVHCAIARQNGIVRMFLNGKFQGSYDFTDINNKSGGTIPSHSVTADLRVGGVAGNNYPMGGYIQDLIVYDNIAKYTEDFVVPGRSILSENHTYTNISGSQTDTLTVTSDTVGSSKVDCVVSNPNTESKISDKATYVVTDARSTIKLEGYGTSSDATLIEKNLDDSEFTITSDDLNFDDICLYASEKDLNVEIDLYGGRGYSTSASSGGEGGYSRISFTMKKNEEYILRGIKSDTALFLYRKASLIAVVGQGGSAGKSGVGGDGGGVNIAGQNGGGVNAGVGGARIGIGQLGENGRFGSRSGINIDDVYPEDLKEESTSPSTYENYEGQTIKCSKGVYWRDQGKGSCEDVGIVKFRLSDGTEVTNSAIIDRGFKSGYSINSTGAASGLGAESVGGHGAVGGTASASGFGGGGGSGYSDGSVTISKTQVGGSTGSARINVRLSAGDFYVDAFGRILILSNTDNRDPRTLTKTTGKVLPGTNTCIDDTRWQRFIDLSISGLQDYRLTATLDQSTTKITNATTRNIHKMLNSNALTLRRSLTGWVDSNYAYTLLALAWDETSNDGMSGYGSDYSILSWSPTDKYGFGYYGSSDNPFFVGSTYSHFSANYWILPPGVPDFS